MKASVLDSLAKKDPFDFLCALEATYHYRRPADFPLLTREGQMAVGLRCFYQCFGIGGYSQVISELHDWLPKIAEALAEIDAEPFASGVKRVLEMAAERDLDLHDEDDAITLEVIDNYHDATMRRDLPHLHRVADSLRRYVEGHAEAF